MDNVLHPMDIHPIAPAVHNVYIQYKHCALPPREEHWARNDRCADTNQHVQMVFSRQPITSAQMRVGFERWAARRIFATATRPGDGVRVSPEKTTGQDQYQHHNHDHDHHQHHQYHYLRQHLDGNLLSTIGIDGKFSHN